MARPRILREEETAVAEGAPRQAKALPEDPFLAALDAVEWDDEPLTAEVIAATEAGDRPSR